jgi:MYXO-CTERM domain-containing protein
MQMYIFDGGTPAWITIVGGATLTVGVADFGAQLFDLTGELVLVNDNDTSGTGGTTSDACTATGWTSVVTGKIAVIDRGQCTFVQKVENAQANGAVGVIILNNAGGGAMPMPGTSATAMIPALSLGRTDGTTLKSQMAAGTVSAQLKRVPVVDRDGTIDNAIVAHEWGHYIQNRLIGDGNGLANNQGGGMGEGWSDFHAMLLIVKGEDALLAANQNFNGVYALAGYTMYGQDPNAYYWGIRRAPYSTDMTKNPFTFKYIQEGVPLPTTAPLSFGQDGNGNSEVHSTGEIWAEMLWECYASLLRDNTRLTFEQARDRMRTYIVGAYKITPLMPTLVEARDAILATVVAADPTDFALFWSAFAKRGIGMGAIAPPRDAQDNTPVTESFLVGNDLQVVNVTIDDSVSSCDGDGNLDLGETGKLTVTIKNVGVGMLSQTTGTVTTQLQGLRVLGGGTLTFPATPPFGTASASVQVTLDNAPGNTQAPFNIAISDPSLAKPGPITLTPQFRVNFDAHPTGSTVDDVEAPMTSWVFDDDPNYATGSDFRRYEDTATSHWFFGPDPDSPADTRLVSPWLTVGQGPFTFSFSHRYQFESDRMYDYDGAVIEITTDGMSWVDIGSHLSVPYTGKLDNRGANPLGGRMAYTGQSPGYPAWNTVNVDLGTVNAGKNVRIRFRIGSDDAVGLKGWEIDNIAFVGITNRPFPSVTTDPNSCTNRPPVVAQPPVRYVNENTHVVLSAMASDPDGDMVTVSFTQVSGPPVNLMGNAFDAPSVTKDTEIDFEVTASDGRAVSQPVTAQVIVRHVPKPPVGTVTPADQTVDEGTLATITGSATSPEGGTTFTYKWEQKSGPAVSLMGADTATLTFTAPQVGADTQLTFQLTVNDGISDGAPVPATVTVHNLGGDVQPPTPVQPHCGCGATDGAASWMAALFAMAMVVARRRRH